MNVRTRFVLALLTQLTLCSVSWAADACRPLRTLREFSTITFDRQSFGNAPRLRAALQRDLIVPADPALFGLSPGQPSRVLPASMLVKDTLGHGAIEDESVRLSVDNAKSGLVVVSGEGGQLLLQVRDGSPLSADGKRLQATPDLINEHSFVVVPGATAHYVDPQHVRIAKGATLQWDLEAESTMKVALAGFVRLEATSPRSTIRRLNVIRPSRGLPDGVVRVQVNATNADFKSKPLTFCFRSQASDGRVISVISPNPKLSTETTDSATFDLIVPDIDAPWSPWGQKVDIRVIGMTGDQLTLDDTASFVVASWWLAAVVGIAVIFIVFLISGWLAKQRDPFKLVKMLILRPTNRYSLSDLQILLWTLLAVFALAFIWVSSGELPTLSNGILVLLGISGASSVLSRGVDAVGGGADAPVATGQESVKSLVMTSQNGFDLLRFQMLAFTIVAWVYSLVSLLRSEGLPELPQNLYVLMGISNATYLGGKVADKMSDQGSTSPTVIGTTATDDVIDKATVLRLQEALGVDRSGQLDPATRGAVKRYKLDHGMVPADDSVDHWLIDSVNATATVKVG